MATYGIAPAGGVSIRDGFTYYVNNHNRKRPYNVVIQSSRGSATASLTYDEIRGLFEAIYRSLPTFQERDDFLNAIYDGGAEE